MALICTAKFTISAYWNIIITSGMGNVHVSLDSKLDNAGINENILWQNLKTK